MFVPGPVPVMVSPPGILVKVHVPGVGKPVKITLPMVRVQVGCVIVPTIGAAGLQDTPLPEKATLLVAAPELEFSMFPEYITSAVGENTK